MLQARSSLCLEVSQWIRGWLLNNTSLNCMDSLICGYFSIVRTTALYQYWSCLNLQSLGRRLQGAVCKLQADEHLCGWRVSCMLFKWNWVRRPGRGPTCSCFTLFSSSACSLVNFKKEILSFTQERTCCTFHSPSFSNEEVRAGCLPYSDTVFWATLYLAPFEALIQNSTWSDSCLLISCEIPKVKRGFFQLPVPVLVVRM